MKIIDKIISHGKFFTSGFINYQPEDVLYIVSCLENYPQQENDGQLEELDLENNGFIEISDNKLHFWAGGDWQKPMEVVLELIDGQLKFTSSKLVVNMDMVYDKQLDDEVVYELMGLTEL